jgi:hypothetical protein
MSRKNLPKYKKFDVALPTGQLTLYAGEKVLTALEEVTTDMTLYKGVRLAEVIKAVYEQGLKDGRRDIIEQMEVVRKKANYLPPGRPPRRPTK